MNKLKINFLTIKFKIILIYISLIFLAFFTRYYLFEDRNSWFDEWHSIYVADPTISHDKTMARYYGDKGDTFLTEFYPPLYLFILKYFFLITDYIDDYGRWLSLIFGVLTIPLSMILTAEIDKKNTKSQTYIYVGLLVTFNLFLTWQSLEIRAHSILIFLSLLNILIFYKVLDKKKFL